MIQRKAVRVQLLYIRDCPLVDPARNELKNSLAQTRIDTVVEELVCDYRFPTIPVDGFVVTGRLRELGDQLGLLLLIRG